MTDSVIDLGSAPSKKQPKTQATHWINLSVNGRRAGGIPVNPDDEHHGDVHAWLLEHLENQDILEYDLKISLTVDPAGNKSKSKFNPTLQRKSA